MQTLVTPYGVTRNRTESHCPSEQLMSAISLHLSRSSLQQWATGKKGLDPGRGVAAAQTGMKASMRQVLAINAVRVRMFCKGFSHKLSVGGP